MRTKQLAPRSFRLQDPEWEQLKIVALDEGYASRHAYLTAHLTAIANASNTQNRQSDRNSIKL
jgi:hypothetical protein